MIRILTALIVAGWICVIALIAIQNASPVSLHVLFLQLIPIPVGLVLAFSVALGVVGMSIVLSLLQTAGE